MNMSLNICVFLHVSYEHATLLHVLCILHRAESESCLEFVHSWYTVSIAFEECASARRPRVLFPSWFAFYSPTPLFRDDILSCRRGGPAIDSTLYNSGFIADRLEPCSLLYGRHRSDRSGTCR